MPSAFLSNPAASPSGPGKARPIASTGPVGPGSTRPTSGGAEPQGREADPVGGLRVDAGEHVVEQRAVRRHRRPDRFAQSCRERTPMSPARIASMPWTAAPRPWTVVMHGMFAITAAVRIS